MTGRILAMQFRVQFLDVSAAVIKVMNIDAYSLDGAMEFVARIDWPAAAVQGHSRREGQ
jgi:hypothetical protein